ncbi:MAG: amidinotransferase [Chitinophagaceae bacterium]|nr:MAG: amidinotransferase [Chitinophagaceae bacterium]
MQNTSQLLMIRPVNFGYNAETAVNNAFQVNAGDPATQSKALEEFDHFVELLRHNGITVDVVNDTPEPFTPDSIFPNNWISFHGPDQVVLYPMFADNRRAERKQTVLDALRAKYEFATPVDLTPLENENEFLEGTGSMVLDRDAKICYACLSPRTSEEALDEFCRKMDYIPIVFEAVDQQGTEIYHTNVLMCVAAEYVVICLDSIRDPEERLLVSDAITGSGKELIEISPAQMKRFAGNMLQLVSNTGEKLLVMSDQAYASLGGKQLEKLRSYNRILHASLNTIETNGGGSARCMMAENFLRPLHKSGN